MEVYYYKPLAGKTKTRKLFFESTPDDYPIGHYMIICFDNPLLVAKAASVSAATRALGVPKEFWQEYRVPFSQEARQRNLDYLKKK